MQDDTRRPSRAPAGRRPGRSHRLWFRRQPSKNERGIETVIVTQVRVAGEREILHVSPARAGPSPCRVILPVDPDAALQLDIGGHRRPGRGCRAMSLCEGTYGWSLVGTATIRLPLALGHARQPVAALGVGRGPDEVELRDSCRADVQRTGSGS